MTPPTVVMAEWNDVLLTMCQEWKREREREIAHSTCASCVNNIAV